jgi:hypothetical protein
MGIPKKRKHETYDLIPPTVARNKVMQRDEKKPRKTSSLEETTTRNKIVIT